MMFIHDCYQWGPSQNLTYSTSAGTAVSTTGFGTQVRYVYLCATGIPTATNGVRIAVGKAPAAVSTSTYLPVAWPLYIQIASGDQISALGNDSTSGSLNVTECLT
jgi:hypothetical protein